MKSPQRSGLGDQESKSFIFSQPSSGTPQRLRQDLHRTAGLKPKPDYPVDRVAEIGTHSPNQSSASSSGFFQPKNSGVRLRELIESMKADKPVQKETSFLEMMKTQLHKQKQMLGVGNEAPGNSKPVLGHGLEKLVRNKSKTLGMTRSHLETSPSTSERYTLGEWSKQISRVEVVSNHTDEQGEEISTNTTKRVTVSSQPTQQSGDLGDPLSVLLLERSELLSRLEELQSALMSETRQREFWRRKTLQIETLLDEVMWEEIEDELEDGRLQRSPKAALQGSPGTESRPANRSKGEPKTPRTKGLVSRLTELARSKQALLEPARVGQAHNRNFSFFGGE